MATNASMLTFSGKVGNLVGFKKLDGYDPEAMISTISVKVCVTK